jgi:hypothetical protein
MIFYDYLPDLTNLVKLCLITHALQIDEILNVLLAEDVVTTSDTLFKPHTHKQPAQIVE